MATRLFERTIVYPESDGKPIAEKTLQFEWIEKIKGGLEALFAADRDVFVAGDLLWYPVEGDNRTLTAPDAMVVFGRPKGHRGSYLQWMENNIAPQVVFEVLSPGNRTDEMRNKWSFYNRYGVSEYYIYNPHAPELTGWMRSPVSGELEELNISAGWTSPRLGIRFDMSGPELVIFRPDSEPFKTSVELMADREVEKSRADRLAERLRALRIDPEAE
jgi:Uma2 family endonuclease